MAKIDLSINTPKSKRELTKENMLAYVKKAGKEADKTWFKKLMKDNQIKKINNLTNETVIGYNYTPIREAFAKRFFPDISKTAKAKAKVKAKGKTFEQELDEL